MGLFQRFFYNFRGQAVNLQIHLNGGDALLSAGYLKVHIAKEVLEALDIS